MKCQQRASVTMCHMILCVCVTESLNEVSAVSECHDVSHDAVCVCDRVAE